MMLSGAALSYLIFHKSNEEYTSLVSAANNSNSGNSYCNYNLVRLGGYEFVHPLMFAEPNCESPSFSQIKSEITTVIDSYKQSGVIRTASVYLRGFEHGDWMEINGQEEFSPGSLLKVPELISFYKMDENKPGFLNKEIVYDKPLISPKAAVYLSKSIEVGKKYTIRELLYYMIAYSDNNATMLLSTHLDTSIFKKTFTDLGLPVPCWTCSDYKITAKEYSLFMRVLHNASYLSTQNSENCVEILTHSDFKDGIVAGLPVNIKIAHKFGEAGNATDHYLSESALIYVNAMPYLITVMTEGPDLKKLPEVLKSISKLVYEKLPVEVAKI